MTGRKVTLVLDEDEATRLAWLAERGRLSARSTGNNEPGDLALVDRIHSARRHRHGRTRT